MIDFQDSKKGVSFKTEIMGIKLARLGETALWLKKTLESMAVTPSIVRRCVITAYEAEANIAVHAEKGVLTAMITPGCIEIVAEDKGPGISDIDLAMQDGYSTTTEVSQRLGFGAGMGLPNIKKNADVLEIDSSFKNGTKLLAKVFF